MWLSVFDTLLLQVYYGFVGYALCVGFIAFVAVLVLGRRLDKQPPTAVDYERSMRTTEGD